MNAIAAMSETSLLTPKALAEKLGVPLGTVHKMARLGYGPVPLKIGKHLRWRRADVDAWLDAQISPTWNKARAEKAV